MTMSEVGASPSTHPDPVASALGALVGAGERLVRLVGEYEAAAQVAALRGQQTPQALYDQVLDAEATYNEAFNTFQGATERQCPKAAVPAWEWARLDELEPGDLIHVGPSLPEGARWLTVVRTIEDGVVTVWVAEQVPPVLLHGQPDEAVRRQTVAEATPDPAAYVPAIGEFDGDPWSAPVTALPFGTPNEDDLDADERREARLDVEGAGGAA